MDPSPIRGVTSSEKRRAARLSTVFGAPVAQQVRGAGLKIWSLRVRFPPGAPALTCGNAPSGCARRGRLEKSHADAHGNQAVKIEGELRARGRELVAVLNAEQRPTGRKPKSTTR